MENRKNIKNIKDIKTVPIPVYSKIRLVNGRLIADVDKIIDTPIEWIKEDAKDV